MVLGRGSDVVIGDAGIRGIVLLVRAEGLDVAGEHAVAEAGVQMARIATRTREAGLTGLEFALAIPGSIGGAVWANAGAHDGEIAQRPGVGGRRARRRDRGTDPGGGARLRLP